jgi:CheY-like chemotaxis protein
MKKILFVDDDAVVARVYREKLAEAGFEVAVAQDGVAAMKMVTQFAPDLVVLDLLMPKFTGADVLKYIRQHPALKTTRVVIFSNSFLAALEDQVGDSGVEYTLSKSNTTPASMIDTIREVLAGPEHFEKPPAPSRPGLFRAPAPPAAAPPLPLPPPPPLRQPATQAQPQPLIRSGAVPQPARPSRDRVQSEFMKHLPPMISGIRQVCRELLEAADTATEMKVIEQMTRKISFLNHSASTADCRQLEQLSKALETLLYHLVDKPDAMTDSCRNTIATAITVLAQFMDRYDPAQVDDNPPPPAILVVDDNAVSNRSLVQTVVGAGLLTTSVMDPHEALAVLRATQYDLVLLDVDMPGMDGIALCEQMRALPLHKYTPVLFITAYSDLRTRSRSVLSGGDDFIPKPVLPRELNVKVFSQLLKRHLDSPRIGG